MKRLRCPQCGQSITFEMTDGGAEGKIILTCPSCGKRIGIKCGRRKDNEDVAEKKPDTFGSVVVLENKFHYRQVFPLHLGDNVIGRFSRGGHLDCAIESDDPSLDLRHCVINVSYDKKGKLKYTLRDGPSNTGTFVGNDILGDRESRIIENGTLFTRGATSAMLEVEE